MTKRLGQAVFNDQQWQRVQQLITELDSRQALWLSGFLAAQGQHAAAPVETGGAEPRSVIAYGSETGNCIALSRQMAAAAEQRGVAVELRDLAEMRVRDLNKIRYLLVICSTHGDGDPPEPIVPFYEALMSSGVAQLPEMHFAVLALGDSSYEQFCATGKQIDERLASLGGQRILPRRDCDVDFQRDADRWMQQVFEALPAKQPELPSAVVAEAGVGRHVKSYSRQQPLTAEVVENIRLSEEQRESGIHHIELIPANTDLGIVPGDAVGVMAHNPPKLVSFILDATGLSGDETVMLGEMPMPVVQALRERCDLTIPGVRFLEIWAELSGAEALQRMAGAGDHQRRGFLRRHQLSELVARYPGRPEAQLLVDSLRPLQPRLYDVANSLNRLDGEIHLVVKLFRYRFGDRIETGIASDHLLQLQPGEQVAIYPHYNKRFRLPENRQAPLILVADGTGIAPYRAFVQELAAGGRSNPCWLVFAEDSYEEDFLYQLEWQKAYRDGLVQCIDTLFYRDRSDVELADPFRENRQRLSEWIENGAHLYFCGDKERLSSCEKSIQHLIMEECGDASVWQQLKRDQQIHRNLY